MQHTSYFDDFLRDEVNLNQSRLNSLEKSIDAIQTSIGNSDYGARVRFFRHQGSLAHKTIIKPQDGDPFDADIVMMVSENADWSPDDYVYDLRRVLNSDWKYEGKVRLSDVCITVEYMGDKRIDIVPLLEVGDLDDKKHICHRRHDEFIRSEPLDFTSWLIEKNRISGGNSFRKVTRLLKYIRDYKKTFVCPSVLLTTLIGEQITDGDRDAAAFATVPATLRTILSRLSAYLNSYATRPVVCNPSYSAEDLGLLWTEDQFKSFKSRVATYSQWANDAFEEADHNESLKKWRRLLGAEFGKGKDKVEDERAIAAVCFPALAQDAAHPSTLVDAVVRFGVRFLPSAFYRPPHLQPAPWPRSTEGALCQITATHHPARGGAGGRPVADGEPLPPEGYLRFVCDCFGLREPPSAYHVQWRVTNTGLLARMRGAFRGDFYLETGAFSRWEPLAFRGVHFVEAFVVRSRDNISVCNSHPFNVVIQ